MIILKKQEAPVNTQANTSDYPSVTELMNRARAAIDTVMTTPEDGGAFIKQICPTVTRGHVSRSTVLAAFKHAIELVTQIKTHDAAAAGAVLEVLETVQAALKADLTLGTAPATATATEAPATVTITAGGPGEGKTITVTAPAAPAQAELPLEAAPAAPAKKAVKKV